MLPGFCKNQNVWPPALNIIIQISTAEQQMKTRKWRRKDRTERRQERKETTLAFHCWAQCVWVNPGTAWKYLQVPPETRTLSIHEFCGDWRWKAGCEFEACGKGYRICGYVEGILCSLFFPISIFSIKAN